MADEECEEKDDDAVAVADEEDDYVDEEEARKIQLAPGETLVELRTEEAHNLPKHDPVI